MKRRAALSTKEMIRAAMFTAATAALSQLSVPLSVGVPITLQTLAIALCGYVLGWKLGLIATGAYILLGAAGLPVFAGLSGGPGILFGMSGGFIWGFLPFALLCGAGMAVQSKAAGIAMGFAGLAVCHMMGVMQFSLVTGTGYVSSLAVASLPFILKDAVSVVAAYFGAMAVRAALIRAKLLEHA